MIDYLLSARLEIAIIVSQNEDGGFTEIEVEVDTNPAVWDLMILFLLAINMAILIGGAL